MDVIICIDIAYGDMLQELILIIRSLAATSVRDQSVNLEKHKQTCIGGQVVPVAAPTAKKRRIAKVLRICERLVNRLKVL